MPPNSPGNTGESATQLALRLEKQAKALGNLPFSNKLQKHEFDLDSIIMQSQQFVGRLQARIIDALLENIFKSSNVSITINGQDLDTNAFDDVTKEKLIVHICQSLPTIPERSTEYLNTVIEKLFDELPPANQQMFDDLYLFPESSRDSARAEMHSQDDRFNRLIYQIKIASKKVAIASSDPSIHQNTLRHIIEKLDQLPSPTPLIADLKADLKTDFELGKITTIDLRTTPPAQVHPQIARELAKEIPSGTPRSFRP